MQRRPIPWTIKYAPKTLKEVAGQAKAINGMLEYIQRFKSMKNKKALLLYGPSGVGKTCSVHALAKDLDFEIIELNASDIRDKASIEQIIGSASKQLSLFAKGKLLLVDEIDGISGKEDSGGLSALASLIPKSRFPIILTANNPFDKRFSTLRRHCVLIEFMPLSITTIVKHLKKICEKEHLNYDEEALRTLAVRAQHDLRAAICDLEIVALSNKRITKQALEGLGYRDKEESIMQALVKIFKVKDYNAAVQALSNVTENLDEVFLWIDENLCYEYEKIDELARAYDWLSKADVCRARIKRWQYWRLLVYFNIFITSGVALSKNKPYKKFVSYKRPTRILKMWISKNRFAKRDNIALKISSELHYSKREVIRLVIDYVAIIITKDKDMRRALKERFDLTKDEISWLNEHGTRLIRTIKQELGKKKPKDRT